MAPSKDAKSRRQEQNRAQRERLAARREAAKAKAHPAIVGDSAPKSRWQKLLGPTSAAGASGRGTTTGSAGASRKPVRPGPDFLRRFGYEEPGGRAVHFAVVLTIAASLLALFFPIIGLNAVGKVPGKHAKGPDAKIVSHVTLLAYQGAKALLVIGAPVVVALITVLLSRPATRKRTWGFGALALFIWVVLGGIGYFYFVPAAAMGFGWWQAGKEEREERMAQAQKAREAKRKAGGVGRGKPAKAASPAGGLFKRRDVVDTTATEESYDDDVEADEPLDVDDSHDARDDGEQDDTGGTPAERGRRPKHSKAEVAAAIAAGRRGQRRPPQR